LSDTDEQDLGSAALDASKGFQLHRHWFRKVPLSPEAKRENVRGLLAGSLVLILAAVVFASFAQQWIHPDRDKELHEWMNLVFSPLVALVGAATGFYFGANSARRD
jgi:hypothetical protein